MTSLSFYCILSLILVVPESLQEINEQEQPSTSASQDETTSAQDDAEIVIKKTKIWIQGINKAIYSYMINIFYFYTCLARQQWDQWGNCPKNVATWLFNKRKKTYLTKSDVAQFIMIWEKIPDALKQSKVKYPPRNKHDSAHSGHFMQRKTHAQTITPDIVSLRRYILNN